MPTITISEKLIKEKKLMILAHKEYEEFCQWKEVMKSFKAFIPTAVQKKDIKKAKEDYKQKKYITLDEFKHKLAIKN